MRDSADTGEVLILSPFFHPEPISTGRYNTALAKGLRNAGHRVTVLASEPLYPDWRPRRTALLLDGVEIVRGGGWMRYPQANAPRRLLLETWYAIFAAVRVLKRRSRTKCAVAILPPVAFLILIRLLLPRMTLMTGIVHDLQSGFLENGHSSFRRVLATAVTWLEGVALRTCDRLIFLSGTMAARAIALHGLDRARCRVHLPFVTLPHREQGTLRLSELLPTDRRHVVYAGALGEKQNPDALLDCLAEIAKRRSDIECHVFSRGPVASRLKGAFGAVPGLRFHDLVADADLDELYSRSDVHLVPQKAGTASAALPSKLPNLIAAGVPVLAICDRDSELGAIVREAEAGLVVHSWTTKDVVEAVDALLGQVDGESRAVRRERAAAYVRKKFSFEALIESIALGNRN